MRNGRKILVCKVRKDIKMKAYIIQKKRDFSIDCLKALAIFLVCQTHYKHYAHTPLDNFVSIVSCMGVPLFFMVNGALLMNKKFDLKRHWKKTIKILCLSIIWKIISVVIMAFIWKKDILENGVAQLLNYFVGKNTLPGYELGHFWYLYALVGIYTVFPLFKLCYDTEVGQNAIKYTMAAIGVFSFGISTLKFLLQLGGYYTSTTTEFSFGWFSSYYIFGTYGYCLFWFLLGGLLYPQIISLREKKDTRKEKTICYLDFAIGWFLLFLMNRFQNIVGEAVWIVIDGYYCIPTLMMCISIFIGCGLVLHEKSNRLISAISQNTWGIYMLHMIVGTAFLMVQRKYVFPGSILLNLIKSIWMLFGSLVVVCVLKKIPVVRGLFTF